MRLTLTDDGEEVGSMEAPAHAFALLAGDVDSLRSDSPDYPAAWAEPNREQFDALCDLLAQAEGE